MDALIQAASKVKRWTKDTIATGYCHSVGLKSGGTVTAVGDNKYGQCDVSSWSDMIAVAAGNAHTLGLNRTARWLLLVIMNMANAM